MAASPPSDLRSRPSPVRVTVLQPKGDRRALHMRSVLNRSLDGQPGHLKRLIQMPPIVVSDPGDAIEHVEKHPFEHVLVLLNPTDRQCQEVTQALANHRADILAWRPGAPVRSGPLLANERDPIVRVVETDLVLVLRKRVLARTFRQWVEVRELTDAQDFHAYFSLRYRVWKEMGYLPTDRDFPEAGLEVHCSDRSSIALGAFEAGRQLVGCVRLVLNREIPAAIERISALLAEQGVTGLTACFERPSRPTLPFDVLDSFPGFGAYYRDWQRKDVSRAELSRVIVDPIARRLGLAEILVDHALSVAMQRGVRIVFLACVRAHEPLYGSSGFTLMPGMETDRFADVDVPAIGMWRRLGESR